MSMRLSSVMRRTYPVRASPTATGRKSWLLYIMPQWRFSTTTRYPISLCEATTIRTCWWGRTVMTSLSMNPRNFIVATQRPVTLSS